MRCGHCPVELVGVLGEKVLCEARRLRRLRSGGQCGVVLRAQAGDAGSLDLALSCLPPSHVSLGPDCNPLSLFLRMNIMGQTMMLTSLCPEGGVFWDVKALGLTPGELALSMLASPGGLGEGWQLGVLNHFPGTCRRRTPLFPGCQGLRMWSRSPRPP